MSKYTRKKHAPTNDEFISFWQTLVEKVAPYSTAIGVTLASALAVWFVVWGVSLHFDHRAEGATERFGSAVKIYDAELRGDDKAASEESSTPRFGTAEERAQAALRELDALRQTHGRSRVDDDALLLRAGILYDRGRYGEAIEVYRQFLATKPAPYLAVLGHEGIGLSQEAEGRLDEALEAYRALTPKTGNYYRDRALFDEARVYMKKGDKKQAAARYSELLTKVPSTPLRDEVQGRLALLEGAGERP